MQVQVAAPDVLTLLLGQGVHDADWLELNEPGKQAEGNAEQGHGRVGARDAEIERTARASMGEANRGHCQRCQRCHLEPMAYGRRFRQVRGNGPMQGAPDGL